MSRISSPLRHLLWGCLIVLLIPACGEKGRLEKEERTLNAELEIKRPLTRKLESQAAAARQDLEHLLGGRYDSDRIKELEDKAKSLESDLDKVGVEEEASRNTAEELKKRLQTYTASLPKP